MKRYLHIVFREHEHVLIRQRAGDTEELPADVSDVLTELPVAPRVRKQAVHGISRVRSCAHPGGIGEWLGRDGVVPGNEVGLCEQRAPQRGRWPARIGNRCTGGAWGRHPCVARATTWRASAKSQSTIDCRQPEGACANPRSGYFGPRSSQYSCSHPKQRSPSATPIRLRPAPARGAIAGRPLPSSAPCAVLYGSRAILGAIGALRLGTHPKPAVLPPQEELPRTSPPRPRPESPDDYRKTVRASVGALTSSMGHLGDDFAQRLEVEVHPAQPEQVPDSSVHQNRR